MHRCHVSVIAVVDVVVVAAVVVVVGVAVVVVAVAVDDFGRYFLKAHFSDELGLFFCR